MKLTFSLKSLGKKRPFLHNLPIDLDVKDCNTLKDFFKVLVVQQVETYNQKRESSTLVEFLNEEGIKQKAESGKVGFGAIYNENKAEADKAIQTVLQAFEDGLIAIFIGDEQIESLDEKVDLNESDSISIIKLSFLSGTMW